MLLTVNTLKDFPTLTVLKNFPMNVTIKPNRHERHERHDFTCAQNFFAIKLKRLN
jgi:hypothetical protein